MDLLATLDRLVHRSRLDVLTPYAGRKPRSLRWIPMLFLGGVVIGYVLFAAGARGGGLAESSVGGLLLFLSFAAANLLRLFGPRLEPGADGQLDERELSVRARAGSIAGSVLVWTTILGLLYAAYASVFGTWLPSGPAEWAYLAVAVQAAWLLLPVLIASWLQPRPPAED